MYPYLSRSRRLCNQRDIYTSMNSLHQHTFRHLDMAMDRNHQYLWKQDEQATFIWTSVFRPRKINITRELNREYNSH